MFSIAYEAVELESTAANRFTRYLEGGRRKRSITIPISQHSSSVERVVEAGFPRMKRCRRSCNLSELANTLESDEECDSSGSGSSLSSSYSSCINFDEKDDVSDPLPGCPFFLEDDVGLRLPIPRIEVDSLSMNGLVSVLDEQMESMPFKRRVVSSKIHHRYHHNHQQGPNEHS
jgi:hypothetical protein